VNEITGDAARLTAIGGAPGPRRSARFLFHTAHLAAHLAAGARPIRPPTRSGGMKPRLPAPLAAGARLTPPR